MIRNDFMRIMTADPGVTGAIAFGDMPKGGGEFIDVRVYDIPVSVSCDVWRSEEEARSEPDEVMILDLIRSEAPDMAVLEHLTPRPKFGNKQGGSSTSEWRTAVGYGALRSAMRIYFSESGKGPAVHPVRPEIWKRALDLGKEKAMSRAMALNDFPEQARFIRRVKDHNRAEAMLLLKYFRSHVLPKGVSGVLVC